MGRASNAKKAKRERPEIIRILREHMNFMELSSEAFDKGHDAESKRLATSIRVLLHDTAHSKSLLGQIGIKEQMLYSDTAGEIRPGNMMSDFPLLMIEFGSGASTYVARLGEGREDRAAGISFKKWWNRPVMRVDEKDWSRWQITRELVNKEGGAHVDPELNREYENLARGSKLGFMFSITDADGTQIGESKPLDGDPIAESVRQITYELLETLYAHEQLLS